MFVLNLHLIVSTNVSKLYSSELTPEALAERVLEALSKEAEEAVKVIHQDAALSKVFNKGDFNLVKDKTGYATVSFSAVFNSRPSLEEARIAELATVHDFLSHVDFFEVEVKKVKLLQSARYQRLLKTDGSGLYEAKII